MTNPSSGEGAKRIRIGNIARSTTEATLRSLFLAHGGILPCGVSERKWGVTSLADLGVKASMADVDAALRDAFVELFGPVAEFAGDRPEHAEFHVST